LTRTTASILNWLGSYVAWRGWAGFFLFVSHQVRTRLGKGTFTVTDPVIGDVRLRRGSSDLHVFRQLIVMREYQPPHKQARELQTRYENVLARGKLPLIIDAGANIGLFTRTAVATFPEARIVCVEPETANLELARQNSAGFGNVHFEQAALWHEAGTLKISNHDVQPWAYSVEAAETGEGEVAAITVDQILVKNPGSELILIKIDIEGAEKAALPPDAAFWQHRSVIYIEPHDHFEGQSGSMRQIIGQPAYHDADFIVRGENLLVFPANTSRNVYV